MIAWELLAQTCTPDGSDMRLTRRGSEYVILVNGRTLMSSRMHGSEEALATNACRHARTIEQPRVLVGGLGMGFTLRATLDLLPPGAIVRVVELVPAVVEWNRGPLGAIAGHPLNDPRVRIEIGDVGFTLRANPGRFDAILLDVDNGPAALTTPANHGLYDNAGVAASYAALRAGGALGVWSAWEDRKFEQRLRFHGFVARGRPRARPSQEGRRQAHPLRRSQASARFRVILAKLRLKPPELRRYGSAPLAALFRSHGSRRRRSFPSASSSARCAGASGRSRRPSRSRYRRLSRRRADP